MAVAFEGEYKGGLGVSLRHGPSQAVIHTAAPVDNHGDGSSFSPTDLVAAGLGACMLTLIAIVAERESIELEGLSIRGEKHMTSAPRRIEKVEMTIMMPAGLRPDQRTKLEKAALTCPVKNSLSEDTLAPTRFVYPD